MTAVLSDRGLSFASRALSVNDSNVRLASRREIATNDRGYLPTLRLTCSSDGRDLRGLQGKAGRVLIETERSSDDELIRQESTSVRSKSDKLFNANRGKLMAITAPYPIAPDGRKGCIYVYLLITSLQS